MEEKNISKGIDECQFLPLNNIICSKANLRTCIQYQLSHNNNLLKYLYYSSSNPLAEEDIVDKEGEYVNPKLFKEKIKDINLTYSDKLPTNNPDSKTNTILTLGIYWKNGYTNNFSKITIYLTILVDQNLVELYDGKNRIDMIENELFKMFDGATGYFLGEIKHVGGSDITVPATYRGERLVFELTDMNRRW